jgi:CelD/BcsL family acetyltransferase involved in cellulose biosynthesis
MICAVLTTPEALAARTADWLDLLSRSRANEVSLTPNWLQTWWRIFGNDRGRQLRVVAISDGDRLVGLAPLTWRRHWYRPCLPFRRLEFLSTGERPEEAICSDYLNVIAEEGREEDVARALAGAIHAGKLGTWDEVFLETMPSDNPMPALLAAALKRGRDTVTSVEYDQARHVTLPATWDAYLAGLGKHRKHSLQALRYFDEWAPGAWQLRTATDAASLAEGRAALIALHTGRWEGTGKGTFKAPRFLAFHDAMMPALLAEGKLQLSWLLARGEPVAAAYNIVHAGKVWYYQTGRRMDVPAKIRPGVVLVLMLIRDAIEKGHREFDFLPGEATYKDQLGTATRSIIRLRVARPTWVESLRYWSRHLAARWRGTTSR